VSIKTHDMLNVYLSCLHLSLMTQTE